ncbi:MAG: hypothetical protein WCJ95_15580 [Mariniphaga sp.]
MKKIILLSVLSAAFLLIVSFQSSSEEWGNWSRITNYNGIEFRVKKGDYNSYAGKYHWELQFRNRYTQNVHFDYDMLPERDAINCNPKSATDIASGEESDVVAYLVNENYRVHVCINNVKMGD